MLHPPSIQALDFLMTALTKILHLSVIFTFLPWDFSTFLYFCVRTSSSYTCCPSIISPELRKGNVSSLSLSPSGPGAVVPRSNREVPLPESGKRGNRDCMAWERDRQWRKRIIRWVHVIKKKTSPNTAHAFLQNYASWCWCSVQGEVAAVAPCRVWCKQWHSRSKDRIKDGDKKIKKGT